MLSRRAAVVFGIADLVTAVLVLFGVFVGLPSRWWPVDVPAALVGALELAAGAALLLRHAWATKLARMAATVALVLGLVGITVMALTASWLAGVYAPIGAGGAIVLVLVAAMMLPYLVALPVVQLVWLRPPAPPPRRETA